MAGYLGNRSTGFAYGLGVGFRKREELGMTPEVFYLPSWTVVVVSKTGNT